MACAASPGLRRRGPLNLVAEASSVNVVFPPPASPSRELRWRREAHCTQGGRPIKSFFSRQRRHVGPPRFLAGCFHEALAMGRAWPRRREPARAGAGPAPPRARRSQRGLLLQPRSSSTRRPAGPRVPAPRSRAAGRSSGTRHVARCPPPRRPSGGASPACGTRRDGWRRRGTRRPRRASRRRREGPARWRRASIGARPRCARPPQATPTGRRDSSRDSPRGTAFARGAELPGGPPTRRPRRAAAARAAAPLPGPGRTRREP